MSNINSLTNSQYYSLTGQQNSTNSLGQTVSTNSIATLADILNGSADSSGDIVDLSPAAQSYLSSLNNSSSVSSLSDGESTNFILSNAQRQKINDILQKYKDEPFTQEIFNKIQDDLREAGLAPDQLAQIDQVNSFNPTQVFIDIISGKQTDLTDNASATDESEKTKSGNYISQILQQWRGISSTTGAVGDVATTT